MKTEVWFYENDPTDDITCFECEVAPPFAVGQLLELTTTGDCTEDATNEYRIIDIHHWVNLHFPGVDEDAIPPMYRMLVKVKLI